MNNQPLVSIKCAVYNHEKYLRECLEGFVMQKTNFPFEAIVHDDASTDGSAAIIREYAEKYPHIIKPIYETENQYSKRDGSIARIMNAAISPSSKYIALCEGDDFWIDPRKLQIQFDFMESHPDYSLCMHEVYIVDDLEHICYKQPMRYKQHENGIDFSKSIVNGTAYYATQSIFFRSSCWQIKRQDIEIDTLGAPMGDTQLMFHLGREGNVKIFNRFMAVYRYHAGSAVSYDDIEKQKIFREKVEFFRKRMAERNNCLDWFLDGEKRKVKPALHKMTFCSYMKMKFFALIHRTNYFSYILSRKYRIHGTNFFKI